MAEEWRKEDPGFDAPYPPSQRYRDLRTAIVILEQVYTLVVYPMAKTKLEHAMEMLLEQADWELQGGHRHQSFGFAPSDIPMA